MYQNKVGLFFFSQISLPQKRTSCNVAAKKAGLVCHKSRGRKKRNYCSLIRGHYTSGLIVKQIASPQKGGVLVTQIIWPQQAYIVPTKLDLKKGGLLLHKLRARNRQTDVLFSNYVTARKTDFLLRIWPQQTDLLFPNYVAAKQTSLFLHKIRGRNQRTYCSSIKWTQNKRAYCYTNNMAATSVLTVPQIRRNKTSGLGITQVMWAQQA